MEQPLRSCYWVPSWAHNQRTDENLAPLPPFCVWTLVEGTGINYQLLLFQLPWIPGRIEPWGCTLSDWQISISTNLSDLLRAHTGPEDTDVLRMDRTTPQSGLLSDAYLPSKPMSASKDRLGGVSEPFDLFFFPMKSHLIYLIFTTSGSLFVLSRSLGMVAEPGLLLRLH